MANKKISELQSRTPALSDLMLVGDPSSGYSYKCTVTALATIIETDIADGYVTIGTTQTISGAKTFSNNLTLTSIANATTTQSKFLTLNASNVVNYRTGAEVLADIGGANDSLVVHKAGDETITGIKTFTPRAKFDAGINLKQGSGASLDTGYSAISADATTFYFHRATSIAALSVNNLTATRTYTLQDANGTLAFLSDITSALTGYVPTSRTLIINGVGFDLSANRTWNVGTVTSVGLSTGTTGTDVNVSGSPITSSGTITLNIPTASATNRGALSSTDWSTFNNKQNALTLTTTGTSGAATLVGSTLNIPQYQAALTNPVTGTGTTNYIPKFTSSSAIGNSQIFDNGTNVGIGTASPSVKLQVDNNSHNYFQLNSTVANVQTSISAQNTASGNRATLAWEDGTRGAYGDLYSSTYLTFTTQSSEKMRLTSGGNLGLGTTSTSAISGGYTGFFMNGSSGSNIDFRAGGTGYGRVQADVNGLLFAGLNSVPITFFTSGSERMRLDASGNLGLGVSPSAWDASNRAVQIGQRTFISNNADGSYSNFGNNAFFNGTNWTYLNSAAAGILQVNGNNFYWQQAASGTSGNAISFTQAMTLDASGRLGIGTTSPAARLHSYSGTSMNQLTVDGVGAIKSGINFANGGTTYGQIYFDNNAPYDMSILQQYITGSLILGTNNTERMRITSGGNVGIGTSNPNVYGNGFTNQFTVSTTSGYANITVAGSSGNSGGIDFGNQTVRHSGIYALDGSNLAFYTNGSNSGSGLTERMRITSGGNVLVGTTTDVGSYKLQVNGNGLFTNSATSLLEVRATNTGGTAQILLNPANNNSYTIQTNGSTDNLTFIRNSTTLATISNIGNAEFGGSIKTAAPSGGTAKPIKFGEIVTLGGSNTQGVRVEIDGTVYYLVTGYLP